MNPHLIRRKLCLIFTILIGLTGIVNAQTVKGKVYDAVSGEPLTGASVQIEQGSFKQYTSVNLDGSYTFRNLEPGAYKLKASFIGFQTTSEFDVILKRDAVAVVDLKMQNSNTNLVEVTVKDHASKESDHSARGMRKMPVVLKTFFLQTPFSFCRM